MAGHHIALKRNLEEITKHGTEDFPIALHQTVFRTKEIRYVPLHWHKEIQLCLVTRGIVRFSINQKEIDVSAGDGIFINSQVIHGAGSVCRDGEDASYCCINFKYQMLCGFPGSHMEKAFVLPYLQNEHNDYLLIARSKEPDFHRLVSEKILRIRDDCLDSPQKHGFEIFADLVIIWNAIFEHLSLPTGAVHQRRPEEYETTRKVISFIEKNLGSQLSLDRIAEEVCLSKWECSRRFKGVVGKTLWSYLLSARMAKAVELLLYSQKTVERIGFEVGFSNVNLFIRQFKKTFGKTPGQFRKHN